MQTHQTPARWVCLPVLPCDRCGDAMTVLDGSIVCGKCRRRESAIKRWAHRREGEKGAKA